MWGSTLRHASAREGVDEPVEAAAVPQVLSALEPDSARQQCAIIHSQAKPGPPCCSSLASAVTAGCLWEFARLALVR